MRVEMNDKDLIAAALAEDVGPGDVTSEFFIPPGHRSQGRIFAKEPCVLSGVEIAATVFRSVGGQIAVTARRADGDRVAAGETVLELDGDTAAILCGERTALNFLQHLSGIATATRRYADAVAHTGARILDTRKTLPGWRALAKKAVRDGGGTNHRMGLYDRVLVKDNHLAATGVERSPEAVASTVQKIRSARPGLAIQFEADTLAQAELFAGAGADFILLDNMTPAQLREAVRAIGGRSKTEASGGITVETVRAVAESGVDFISVGALTHSVKAVDLSLEIYPQPRA